MATIERTRVRRPAVRERDELAPVEQPVAHAAPDGGPPIFKSVALLLTGILLLVAVEITLAFSVAYLVTGHAY